MKRSSNIKRELKAINSSVMVESAITLTEMPETPELKLLPGKVSTATRKTLLPFAVPETD
jgi:hypothetical protein